MKKIIIIGIISLLLLTSCWDITEIEEVGFVLAVGVDRLTEQDLEQYKDQYKKETGKSVKKMYKTTYQVVIPSMLVDEGTAFEELPFFNITTVGKTAFKMTRKIAARRSRRLNYEHVKVLIISEDVVKDIKIEDIVDFYIRDHEMRRDTLIYLSKKNAKDILNKKLPLEIMPAISIKMIQNNYEAQHGMLEPLRIGELTEKLLTEQSYVVPRITSGEGDLVVGGGAVFLGSTNDYLGWLGEFDIESYKLVRGEAGNLVIEAYVNDEGFIYEMDNSNSSIEYAYIDGKDYFTITIKGEGYLSENQIDNIDLAQEEWNQKLIKEVENEIERSANMIIEKAQRTFCADIFELSDVIKRKNYKRWKEVKENWDGKDGFFENAQITVKSKIKIRHYMTKEQIQ